MPSIIQQALRCGGVVIESDATPDPFTFQTITEAARATNYQSNTVTITGINEPVPVVLSPFGYSLSIDGGSFSNYGTIRNGQTLTLRGTSWNGYSHTDTLTITIGSYSTTWTIITAAEAEQHYLTDSDGGTIFTPNAYSGPLAGGASNKAWCPSLYVPNDGKAYYVEADLLIAGSPSSTGGIVFTKMSNLGNFATAVYSTYNGFVIRYDSAASRFRYARVLNGVPGSALNSSQAWNAMSPGLFSGNNAKFKLRLSASSQLYRPATWDGVNVVSFV